MTATIRPRRGGALTAVGRRMRSLTNLAEVMVIAYCRSHGYPLEGIPKEALSSPNPRPRAS